MLMNWGTKACSDRKAIMPLLWLVFIVALVAVAYVALSQLQTQQRSPVKIKDFGIQPSTFKANEEGQLSVGIENLLPDDSVTVMIYFETHKNVKVYQGSSLLPIMGGNYTLTKQLDPCEISELKFTVKGSIDVGDHSRDYYIRAYCYLGSVCFDIRSVSFTINES
jgi:hypothetical protein